MKKETLRKTAIGEIALRLDLRAEPSILRQRAAFGVRRALEVDPSLRKKAVRWIVLPQKRLEARLSRSLDRLWNGMRVLPYSDEDIAEAVGLCFGLNRLRFVDADKERAGIAATTLLGEVVLVEFGSWDGSYARGFASAVELRTAVRDDLNNYLLKQYWENAKFVRPLLQICSSPNRLFPFSRLARVFGRQIIPTQVLRSDGRPSFYSPARLEAFGLP